MHTHIYNITFFSNYRTKNKHCLHQFVRKNKETTERFRAVRFSDKVTSQKT